MSDLFCRIRVPYQNVLGAVELIAKKCDKVVIYEHNERQDNIHIHCYLQRCTVSTDTLKNYFKRSGFSGGDKGAGWSFKTATDNGCVTYMTKGKLEPVFVQGYTEEEIQQLKSKWEDREPKKQQSQLVSYVVKENPEQSKKRQWDMVQEIVKTFNEQPHKTGRELCRIIRQVVVVQNKTLLGRYKLRDYYDTAKALINDNEWSLSAAQFCEKDFF